MNGNPSTIKQVNLDLISSVIETFGPISKPDISRKTKLSLVTVNKLVDILLKGNSIKTAGHISKFKGRPAETYTINEKLYYFICLYYYNKNCHAALMDYNGNIVFLKKYSIRTNSLNNSLKDLFTVIDEILLSHDRRKTVGIAFAAPGIVSNGVLKSITSISSWEGLNLCKIIKEKYNIPVIIENDTKVAAWGLYLGKYKKDYKHLAYLYFNQGVGAGFVCGGHLFTGKTNLSGEIGIMHIDKNNKKINIENKIIYLREKIKEDKEKEHIYKNEIKNLIKQIIEIIIITMNPEIILIKFNEISEKDCEEIIKDFDYLFPTEEMKNHLPILIKVDDVVKSSLDGLWNMSYKLFKPSLVIENR